jgi:hypothetical protein
VGDRAGDAQDWSTNRWNDVTGVTASNKASQAQERAAKEANNTQIQMFNASREDQRPFLEVGQKSINRLADMYNTGEFNKTFGGNFQLGSYGDQQPGYQAPGAFNFNAQSMGADPGVQFRIDAANKALERSAAAKGGSLGGGQLRALSTLNQGLASQEYGNAYNRARGAYETDRGAGMQLYGQQLGQYNQNRDSFNQNQLAQYGIYNDARNEFYQNQGNQFNRLAALSGIGQTTGAGLGAQSSQLGQSLGNNLMAGANARAAGIVGAYNSQRDTVMGLGKLAAAVYGGA